MPRSRSVNTADGRQGTTALKRTSGGAPRARPATRTTAWISTVTSCRHHSTAGSYYHCMIHRLAQPSTSDCICFIILHIKDLLTWQVLMLNYLFNNLFFVLHRSDFFLSGCSYYFTNLQSNNMQRFISTKWVNKSMQHTHLKMYFKIILLINIKLNYEHPCAHNQPFFSLANFILPNRSMK